MTPDQVVATQLIEGGVDATLFENFVYHTLSAMRRDRKFASKELVLFMDNAVIHKHPMILETARNLKVTILFNCEYSPWLNPVEQLFGVLKKKVRDENI